MACGVCVFVWRVHGKTKAWKSLERPMAKSPAHLNAPRTFFVHIYIFGNIHQKKIIFACETKQPISSQPICVGSSAFTLWNTKFVILTLLEKFSDTLTNKHNTWLFHSVRIYLTKIDTRQFLYSCLFFHRSHSNTIPPTTVNTMSNKGEYLFLN